MEDTNLWDIPSADTFEDTTDNIKGILKRQAEYLKNGTNGKVKAKFNKIVDLKSGLSSVIAALSWSKTEDDEINNLQNANELYSSQRYGFEIYNDSFKFRIFEMNLSPLYPVSIYLDEGVLEDSGATLLGMSIQSGKYANEFKVTSDNELKECLQIVFSSKKVKYILYRLQQMADISDDRTDK